jgi:hypothetical protein
MLVSKTLSLYHLALSQNPHSRHVDTSAYSDIIMYTKKNNHELWLSSPPVSPNTKQPLQPPIRLSLLPFLPP